MNSIIKAKFGDGGTFLNQIAEYLYIAFQSAGNFLIFQAATS